MNNKRLHHHLKRHLEDYSSQQLAQNLLCLLPLDKEFDLRPLIGNAKNRNNLEAIQTWVKATQADYPSCGFELTIEQWFSRLVCDLLIKSNMGDEA